MTSRHALKAALEFEQSQTKFLDEALTSLQKTYYDLHKEYAKQRSELDAYKAENNALIGEIHSHADHLESLVQFIDDLFIIEPQLKHTLTDSVWDFERVHRAAEALRADDALASLGYTDQCVEWPENVTPLFPRDPEEGAA